MLHLSQSSHDDLSYVREFDYGARRREDRRPQLTRVVLYGNRPDIYEERGFYNPGDQGRATKPRPKPGSRSGGQLETETQQNVTALSPASSLNITAIG